MLSFNEYKVVLTCGYFTACIAGASFDGDLNNLMTLLYRGVGGEGADCG